MWNVYIKHTTCAPAATDQCTHALKIVSFYFSKCRLRMSRSREVLGNGQASRDATPLGASQCASGCLSTRWQQIV